MLLSGDHNIQIHRNYPAYNDINVNVDVIVRLSFRLKRQNAAMRIGLDLFSLVCTLFPKKNTALNYFCNFIFTLFI